MGSICNDIREAFGKSDKERDKDLLEPSDINIYRNLSYGDDPNQLLDLYTPQNDNKKPVIINFHGGAWVYGDKEGYKYYCMSLANQEFAVVNFTYRLAPEYKFPSALEDMNLVMNWLKENANKYNLDLDNIFAIGDSAGAHYLSLYALILTNKSYQDLIKIYPTHNLHLNAMILNCGIYNFKTFDLGTNKLMKHVLQSSSQKKLIKTLDYIDENYVPVMIMTCQNDFLKENAGILIQKLIEKNVEHEYIFYTQGLGHVFNLDIRKDVSREYNNRELMYFRHKMKRGK